MNVVNLEPSSYMLKPLEALVRVVNAPNFLSEPNSTFAEYLAEKVIRASASNSSISGDVTVLVSQAHMGVSLFRQQRETARMLSGFVYKMVVPDHAVPTGMKFQRRYTITDQREAQQGTYDTICNGVQTREYSQTFQHTSKVVTMQFGSLLGITVPSVAKDLIQRELERVSASWELTRTIDVLQYCAAQPTLTDRVVHRTKTATRAEKLDAVLVLAEIVCGLVNVQPDSVLCILENARRILGSDRPEVLILGDTLFRIISQKSSNSRLYSSIFCEDTKITPEFSVYTIANETARVGKGYEFTMQQVTRNALGDRDLPFVNDSVFQDSSIDMKVNYVRLGGGPADRIPLVHVDGVQMEPGGGRDTSTEHKAFCNSDGFKWEYFTVGCTPPALGQIDPNHVLSATDSDNLNYRQLAQRSPSVSYIHQYDGTVAAVNLRGLHAAGNPRELFSRERRARLQHEVNALMRGSANAIAVKQLARLGHSRDWYSKITNPASVLEFDTRNMVVPCPPQDPSGGEVQPERWVVRPRVALFNSSSMNNIENEMAQIGSELLAHFKDTGHAKNLKENLSFLEQALYYEQGIESMLAMRDRILAGGHDGCFDDAEWTAGRRYWSWLVDPVCAVYTRRALAHKETNRGLACEERTVLVQVEALTNSLLTLFRAIVGNRKNSVVASMPFFATGRDLNPEYGYPDNFSLDDVDYCNIMYWIVLPVLGAKVYRIGNVSGEEETTTVRLAYRAQDRDLNNALGLNNENALTALRVNGRCAFSKVAPGQGTDVSHLFEPTASVHERCTQAGFSATSVVTYMWAIRVQKLTGIGDILAKVLLGLHYSTLMTHEVIRDHYDTKYYSGMSYLLFRGVRFTGCGVSLMQQKSALYTLGTQSICKPTAHNTHQVYTVNQYCESVVMPETLESPGLYMPNLYMRDVRGGDVLVNTGSPFDVVVADAFNGFSPESDSASGYRRPYIFTTGRSERLNGSVTRDPLTRVEAYTCMPTLLHPFSSTLTGRSRQGGGRQRNGEESNHKLFRNTLHMAEFEKGVLDPIGDPFRDTVARVNGEKRTTDIMQPLLGVAFCGTYGIGLTSDKRLMVYSDSTHEGLVDRLAPRISGTGVFSCSPVQTTSKIITPVFNRVFECSRYWRVLET